MLQTFKNQFEKYLKYCSSYDIKNIKDNNILIALNGLKELKNIKNDTTNIDEYMEDLNQLKYHYILRKIVDFNIINSFNEENFTFNDSILSQHVKNNKTTLDAKIKELKKTIINLLDNKYSKIKTIAKDGKNIKISEEYFKYVHYDKKEEKYYNDKDDFGKIFENYKNDIHLYKEIAIITINEDKYVIYCNYGDFKIKKCIGKKGGLKIMDGKTVNGTPINNIKENENLKIKFIIAYVRQFENTNS